MSLFAAVGLNGLATAGLWTAGAVGAGAGAAPTRLPLNGGIVWMTIGILLAPSLPATSFAVLLAVLPAAATGGFAVDGGLAGAAGDPSARDAEGDALSVAEVLIARACEDSASFVDFSLIWRCFSSSLARIGTRSSGMGLLS